MKFSLGIVLFDGEIFLEELTRSLSAVREKDVEILLKDHSKNGSTLAILQKKFPAFCAKKNVQLFQGENTFHSGGHNFLAKKSSGEVYICGSQDMIFSKNFLEELEEGMAHNPDFSVFTGKIFSMNNPENGVFMIDSCGIFKTDSHFFGDRGQGEKDGEKFSEEQEIWGVSGAFFAVRKNAYQEILKHDGYFFDENLHYKNDVDLSYRLQKMKMKAKFLPKVHVFHVRQLGVRTKKKSHFQKKSSCKGHFLVLKKHFFGKNFQYFSWKERIFTLFSAVVRWIYCKW